MSLVIASLACERTLMHVQTLTLVNVLKASLILPKRKIRFCSLRTSRVCDTASSLEKTIAFKREMRVVLKSKK